jgi:hypothetical protein
MRITMLASASAIVLFATVGSLSAADQKFSTLNGVKAVPMSSLELNAIKGMDHHFFVNGVQHETNQQQDSLSCTSTNTTICPVIIQQNLVPIVRADGQTRLAAPSYRGLILHACGNGVITGPSTAWC